jgi:hypothetical protein
VTTNREPEKIHSEVDSHIGSLDGQFHVRDTELQISYRVVDFQAGLDLINALKDDVIDKEPEDVRDSEYVEA